jgi:hypothetical protein
MFVAILLLFGAVLEFQRQLHQIRQHMGLIDQSIDVQFAIGISMDDLPEAVATGATIQRSAILLLSDTCSTCYEISKSLGKHLIPGLTVVIAVRDIDLGRTWLEEHGLTGFDNVVLDQGETADALELHTTPSIVRFEDGKAVSATTVPSIRLLGSTIKWLTETARQSTSPDLAFKGD